MIRLMTTLAILVALAGCVEPPPRETVTQEIDPTAAAQAQAILAEEPEPKHGWLLGIVMTEDEREVQGLFGRNMRWSISVLDTSGEVTVLTAPGWCDEDDSPAGKVLSVLVSPGDLITWTGDQELCLDEVRVVRKAGT